MKMRKKILAIALCAVLMIVPVASLGVFAADAPGCTLDAATKTYTVTTADGLIAVATELNSGKIGYNITLAADIDLAGKTWTPIGTKDVPYMGTFDGGNFTISNLTKIVDYQTVNTAGYCSLIGKAYDGTTVKNVKFTGATVQGVEFNSLVIGETAQASKTDTSKKVVIENVHVRNSDIKGSQGWAETPDKADLNEYTGALIGKAGAYYTEVNNCSVVATITSEYRTSGLIGGEAVDSGVKTAGVTITNCFVGGSVTHAKVPTGSNTLKSGGASGLFGYHSTIPLTVKNCVVAATLASSKLVGAISYQTNKLTLNAENVIITDYVFGKVNDVSSGATTTIKDIFVYKYGDTNTTMPVAKALNDKDEEPVKVNGADEKWKTAVATVISSNETLEAKLLTMFANNTSIDTQFIKETMMHEHECNQEIVDNKYLASAASCTAASTYYKSCACGYFDTNGLTFVVGEPVAHAPSENWTSDDDNHWHFCSTCLEEKSDVAAHTFGDWTVSKEPTEVRQGERVKACTVCGYEISEKIPKITAENTTAADDAEEGSGGCGSTVTGMGVVLVAVLGMGVTVLKKKG